MLTVVSLTYGYISGRVFLFEQRVFEAAKPLQVFSPGLEEPQNARFASVTRNCALCISEAPRSFSLFLTAFSFAVK